MQPNAVSKPMSLAEARQVPMMFPRYQKRSLGSLLDSGELVENDLIYTAQKAFDPRLREAAAIILEELRKKLSSTEIKAPLNLVGSEYRSYAERKQLQLMGIAGIFLGIVLSILARSLFDSIISAANRPTDSTTGTLTTSLIALVIVIILLLIAYFVGARIGDYIGKKFENNMRRFRKGQQAEDRVLNVMYYALDGDWWLFRNVELPNRKADIDFVLLGRKGIWIFEVKAYEGMFRNRGNVWEAYAGNSWKTAHKNPTKQALGNATELNKYLKAKNINLYVNPIVIWANPEAPLSLEAPAIPVWTLDNLSSEVVKLENSKRIDEATMQQIVTILSETYPKDSES